MGGGSSRHPPVRGDDLRILLSYNLRGEHIAKLWGKFKEVDHHFNGAWTVSEMYTVIQEPRLSMRAPIIDALFFMGDGRSEGSIGFEDFLVLFTSFCALNREEVLQLLFIVVDRDRNGTIEKDELLDFFSYVPMGSGHQQQPVFPVNNKSALDKFRGGHWNSLEFDGFALLCEQFPYISYPAYHTQTLYRQQLLGKSFWEKLDLDRSKSVSSTKTRTVLVPGTRERMEVKLPGRCTMQELLEFSRRRTSVNGGKRVEAYVKQAHKSQATQERDEQILTCPILKMIRNSRCMYHVPSRSGEQGKGQQKQQRPELELPVEDVPYPEAKSHDAAALKPLEGAPPGVLANKGGAVVSQADLEILGLELPEMLDDDDDVNVSENSPGSESGDDVSESAW